MNNSIKKLIFVLVVMAIVATLAFALVACGDDPCGNGHTWGEWTIVDQPTCTQPGKETKTCSVCGDTLTREVDITDHNYVYGKCEGCGAVEEGYIPPAELFVGNVFQIEIQDLGEQTIGAGSGFVLDRTGWFITNSHVMEDAYYATALFEIPDEENGNAFTRLQIEWAALNNPNQDYFIGKIKGYEAIAKYYREIELSDDYEIGGVTYSVGYPNSTPYMEIHRGNAISAATSFEGKLNGVQYVASTSYIMPGSSGGVLLNDELEVIGLTTLVSRTWEGEFVCSYSVSSFNFRSAVAKIATYKLEELALFMHPAQAEYINFLNYIKQFSDVMCETKGDGTTVYYWAEEEESVNEDGWAYSLSGTYSFSSDFMIDIHTEIFWGNGHAREEKLYGYWSPSNGFNNLQFDFKYSFSRSSYYAVTSPKINYSQNIDLTLHTYETAKSSGYTITQEDITYAKEQFNSLYEWLLYFWQSKDE